MSTNDNGKLIWFVRKSIDLSVYAAMNLWIAVIFVRVFKTLKNKEKESTCSLTRRILLEPFKMYIFVILLGAWMLCFCSSLNHFVHLRIIFYSIWIDKSLSTSTTQLEIMDFPWLLITFDIGTYLRLGVFVYLSFFVGVYISGKKVF